MMFAIMAWGSQRNANELRLNESSPSPHAASKTFTYGSHPKMKKSETKLKEVLGKKLEFPTSA